MSLDDWTFICADCALRKGCTYPEGHLATAHEGECDCCGKIKTLLNVGDWDWPDGKARGMRD